MTPQRIAFLCHPYHRGGVTRWMADAALYYAALGREVYFVAPEPAVEFYSARGRESMVQLIPAKSGVKLITERAGREFEFGTPVYQEYVYKRLLSRLPSGIPVIVSDDHNVWNAACALRNSFPVVGVLHADDAAYYTIAARQKSRVDIFVSVANRVDRLLKQNNPDLPASKLFVIPCGISLPLVAKRNAANKTLELLYVGRIENVQKRAEDLISVAIRLRDLQIPFRLQIIGDGLETRTRMEDAVRRLNMESQVTFTGWLSREKVLATMSLADVLVLVSNYEGMPVSMMEALASGCGFAGTRVSGIEDYEEHRLAWACFRVFDIGDTSDAAAKIVDLAAIKAQERAAAARQLAEEEFSMATCLDRYDEAIKSISRTEFTAPVVSIGFLETAKSKVVSTARLLKMKAKR